MSAAPARGAGLRDTPTTSTWVTNGTVYAIAATSSTIYLGGYFSEVGPVTGGGVPISMTNGKAVSTFPKVEGSVNTCVPDGTGGWFIQGDFSKVGGLTRNFLAHILSDGQVDPNWNPNPSNNVTAMAVSGSTVYVGGYFGSIGGQTRAGLAALDATTGKATAWNPQANGAISTLAVSGGKVYAGGYFTVIGGQTRHYLAALDAASGAVTAWNPDAGDSVGLIVVSGSTVYVSGNFYSIGGQARNHLAAVNASTGVVTSWAPTQNSGFVYVYAFAALGGIIYVGGTFDAIGGQTRHNIAALDATTGLATAWNPGADDIVCDLVISGGTVYAGGVFKTIGGQTRHHLAALDASTGAVLTWNPNANDNAYSLAISGGTIYAGGAFTSIGGQTRQNIAALDAATGAVTAWNPGASDSIQTLLVSNGIVYAGGAFTSIGGQLRSNLAALDASSGKALPSWNSGFINISGAVQALALANGTLYVGGTFSLPGDLVQRNLVAVDAGSGSVKDWKPNADGDVNTLAVNGGTVYAGGDFIWINGQTRNHLAALDASTGALRAWNPNANQSVYTLSVSNGIVYAGGRFNAVGGLSRNMIAALDATTGIPTAWAPQLQSTSDHPFADCVRTILISNGTVYAGGSFDLVDGQDQPYLTCLDITSGVSKAWNPQAKGEVDALEFRNGTLYAGGRFGRMGQEIQPNFARFDTDPPSAAPDFPHATALDSTSIRWEWADASDNEDGFKVWADAGTGAPTTLRATTAADATSWTMSGLAANSQYTFQVAATNAAGDSARSAAYTTWTLIEPVTALTFPSVSDTGLEVEAADTFSNITAGVSGVYFSNDTQGTASGWVQSKAPWVRWVNTGLTPNTLYAFRGRSRNGARVSGAGASASQWTLAAVPSIGNNITCDKAPGTVWGVGTFFNFSNPAGFGTGTHGGSAYKVRNYSWVWDTAPMTVPGSGDALWISGKLSQTPTTAGAYYLHLMAYNGAGAAQLGVLHYGPFTVAEAGRLTAAPSMLSFLEGGGWEVNVERGGTPTFQNLTLTNTGGLPVVFTGGASGTPGLALVGRCAADYAIQSVTPATSAPLAPGGSVTVRIQFAPVEARRTLGLDAALRVTCDSPQTPSFDILLLGDAVPVELSEFRVE